MLYLRLRTLFFFSKYDHSVPIRVTRRRSERTEERESDTEWLKRACPSEYMRLMAEHSVQLCLLMRPNLYNTVGVAAIQTSIDVIWPFQPSPSDSVTDSAVHTSQNKRG